MKAFQKLALVSAIAMTSSVYALEVADDATLAGATGQQGIDIQILLPDNLGGTAGVHGITIGQVNIHDGDGYAAIAGNSGALQIGDRTAGDRVTLSCAGAGCVIGATPASIAAGAAGKAGIFAAIDMEGGATPTLNINVFTPTLTITTGNIYVADSVDANIGQNAASTQNKIKLLDSMTVTLGGMNLNIQLGTEVQTVASGATTMIKLDSTITGGLTITGFALNDSSSNQTISIGTQKIIGAGPAGPGSSDVVLKAGVDVVAAVAGPPAYLSGLQITLDQFGVSGDPTSVGGGVNISMETIKLGSSPVMGSVELRGLNLNGTQLIIAGH